MIRSLFVRLVEAVIDERQALAELHRANARRAEVVQVSAPVFTPAVEEIEFFACSYRAAECVMQGLQDASLIECPYHKLSEGKTCPGEPEEDLASLEAGYPYPVAPVPVPPSAQALP